MKDIIFIEPNSASHVYQGLAKDYAAIETPTWSLLLAQSCRSKGFDVGILDANALRLSPQEVCDEVWEQRPRIICFVVYGQNPNSGTANMVGAYQEAEFIKNKLLTTQGTMFGVGSTGYAPKIVFVGSHTSALPLEVLEKKFVDIVLVNEGVYALHNLLSSKLTEKELETIKGIGWKIGTSLILNEAEKLVPHDRMDIDLPGYAWDLLPYKENPFDLYRAHFWHTNYKTDERSPFAAIYTSLGCTFQCEFCMINILNRTSNSADVVSSDFNVMRFWSPEFIIKEFDKLADYGVKNIRISDEMFFLNKKYYEPLLDLLIERDHKFNMWAYSRIDTCREQYLSKFKKAGVNWLALGIEAASPTIRQEITKGKFKDVDIRDVVKKIKNSGIKVVGNIIFGFPNEDYPEMQQTLDLALELKCEFTNMYCAAALPGSPLHRKAKENNWELPSTPQEWSFFSYECKPLPTNHLSAAEVLEFRDKAWEILHADPDYLKMIEETFGADSRQNLEAQSKIKLKRKLLTHV